LRHALRPRALRERIGGFSRQSRLERERIVHAPFELLREAPRDDQHRELGEARLERALVAQVLADFLQPLHELRAAQERDEGPAHAAARTGGKLGGGAPLRFGHRFGCEGRHAVVHAVLL
jgi:hypothetical protein